MISAEIADRQRERPSTFWQPGRKLLKSTRDYQRLSENQGLVSSLRNEISVVRYRSWLTVTAADMSLNCQMGSGLFMHHPYGIIIHSVAKTIGATDDEIQDSDDV